MDSCYQIGKWIVETLESGEAMSLDVLASCRPSWEFLKDLKDCYTIIPVFTNVAKEVLKRYQNYVHWVMWHYAIIKNNNSVLNVI